MNLIRLGKLFSIKYAKMTPQQVEANLRRDVHTLWKFPNELFNILRACAESNPKNPKDLNEEKAVDGYKFCQNLLTMIDYLQSNIKTASLGEIREILHNIVSLIKKNKNYDDTTQFGHVSELIFQMIPATTKHARTIRDQQFGKAKTGLARILSLSLSMLEAISELEIMIPEAFKYKNVSKVDIDQKLPERFDPQRAPLSIYDTIDFIRQHGPEYGISDKEDWGKLFIDDPILKEEMTTIINAINRGHYPRNSAKIKAEISKILEESNSRKVFEEI